MLKKIIFITLTMLVVPTSQCRASHGWLLYFEGMIRGRVYDARTKEPIEGAVVAAVYNIRLCGPAECGTNSVGFKEALSKKNGSFYIYPHIFGHPWPFALGGEDTYLIVYKPGYKSLRTSVGYIWEKNEIALEPVPATYYPRHEELEKAEGIYGIYDVRWKDTRLLKDVIIKEENALKYLDLYYPDGVLFFGGPLLSEPHDIVVDKSHIYVGTGFLDRQVRLLDIDGRYLTSYAFEGSRFHSSGTVALALKKEGQVWAFASNCLKEINMKKEWSVSDIHCYWTEGEFAYHMKRFKVDGHGKIYAVTEPFPPFPLTFLITNVEGEILHGYQGRAFSDIIVDSKGYFYGTFRGGLMKFNSEAVPVKSVDLEDRGIWSDVNVAIDGQDRIYRSYHDSIAVYDSDLNRLESIDIKNPKLGEINIAAMAVDAEGNYLYLADGKYGRIIRYDLKNKRLSPRVKDLEGLYRR